MRISTVLFRRQPFRQLFSQLTLLISMAASLTLLSACGGGGGGGGGGSGSGANSNWPGSLIGERIEFTVEQDISSGVSPGLTVVYDFSVGGQVRGTNPVTGQVLTPTSYEYSHSGPNARVRLHYDYSASGGGTGYEDYLLKGAGSILQGTYNYEAVVTQGSSSGGKATGRYRIIIPSASVVELEGTEPLTGNELLTLESLRFEEALENFELAPSWSQGYVALRQDGSITSYSPRPTLPTQCNNPPCPSRTNPILLSPSGSHFVEVGTPYTLAGYARTSDGNLVMWGDEAGVSPRIATFAGDGKVHALIKGFGQYNVVMQDGTVREPLCLTHENMTQCQTNAQSPSQRHLDLFPEVSNIRYMNHSARLFVDAAGVLHHFKHDGTGYQPWHTPTGLPLIRIAKGVEPLIVALSTDGQLLAWHSDDLSTVEVPSFASSGIVDFEVARTGSDPNRYHVAAVKNNGAAALWLYDENLALLSSEQVREPGSSRYVRFVWPSRFIFIR